MKYLITCYSFVCFFIPIYSEFSLNTIATDMQLPIQTVQEIFNNITDQQEHQERGKGWSKYYHLLSNVIKQRGYQAGCEVGVAYGGHSVSILKKTGLPKLYSVDPYLEYGDTTNTFLFRSAMDKETKQHYWDLLYLHVRNRLSVFGDRAELLRMTSLQAADLFKKESLDFVFLDANHSFESVMQDLYAWFDKIKSGGFFCGDDYVSARHPGVTRAVNQFFKDRKIKVHTHKSFKRFWWIEKQ